MVKSLVGLVKPLDKFECISIGFPGVIRGTRVITAPHLGTDIWAGYDLAGKLSRKLGDKPARIVNDADMQGLAVVKGKGIEFVITLGTGIGTALFRDGDLMPHMELAHMPAADGKDFDGYIGDKVLKKIGRKRWNKRVAKMLPYFQMLLHYDHLYIGGGNAKRLTIKLPRKATIVSNIAGSLTPLGDPPLYMGFLKGIPYSTLHRLLPWGVLGFGVNVVTGDYSRGAAGLWIRDGELAFAVSEVTIAGNLNDMLRGIEAIASDLEFRGSVAAPTIKMGEMTVGGK